MLYTYFYASPRIELFGITNSGYCRHNNSILAYSPLERLLPRPPDRNFDTHNNQYNDLNLVIFTSAPNLTNQTHDPLTSILALRFASYIVSQQFAKPLHWVDSNTLLGIFSYQCSWSERGYSLSQPIPNILGREEVVTFLNQYLTTGISYITTTHMNAWLRKYESLGFGWGKGLFPFSTLQTYYTTYMGICQPPIRYFFYLINN